MIFRSQFGVGVTGPGTAESSNSDPVGVSLRVVRSTRYTGSAAALSRRSDPLPHPTTFPGHSASSLFLHQPLQQKGGVVGGGGGWGAAQQ